MDVGDVAQTQVDGIYACLVSQLVHRVFQRKHPDRFTGRAHGSGTGAVNARDLVRIGTVLACIEKMGGKSDGFAKRLAG